MIIYPMRPGTVGIIRYMVGLVTEEHGPTTRLNYVTSVLLKFDHVDNHNDPTFKLLKLAVYC